MTKTNVNTAAEIVLLLSNIEKLTDSEAVVVLEAYYKAIGRLTNEDSV